MLERGIDGLRLNPGNIGERWKVAEVVKAASERQVPIRIGVNAGSLEKELLAKYGHPTAEAMVESALGHVRILEELGYDQIKISLKASDVMKTVAAYRLLAEQVDYPLHIGITEAGTTFSGTIKSAVGLGILLADGIGDTMRVSLTGDPVDEVRVGLRDPEVARASPARGQFRLLPHLRPLPDQPDPGGRGGGAAPAGDRQDRSPWRSWGAW